MYHKDVKNNSQFLENCVQGGKRMKKRLFVLVLTGIMSTGLFTGCSTAPSTNSERQSTKETKLKEDETVIENDSDDIVTLELFWQKSNVNVIQQIIDKFEKENPKIKIELTAASSDSGKQIFQTRMATNEPMDLVQHWPSQAEFRSMCKEGRVVDLSDYEWNDTIMDAYYDMSCVDNKLYSVPLSINAGVVAYNKDIFDANHIEVPTTWDELITAADTLKSAGVTPFIFSNGEKENCSQKFHIMTASVADENWNPYDFYVGMYEGSGAAFSDNEYSKKAAERLHLLSSKYSQDDPMSTNYDISMQMFANGDAAMMITGTWAQSDIEKNNPDINMGMFAMPTDDGVNMLVSTIDPGVAAMTGTGKEEYAVKFLEFISRPENAQIYTDNDKSPSPIEGVEVSNPTIDLVLSYINEGKVTPWWRDFISTGVVSDEADIAQAFLMDGDIDTFLKAEEEIVLRQE